MTKTTPFLLSLALLVTACGDDDDAPAVDAGRADASPADAGADAMPALGCAKLDAPVTVFKSYPASYTGSIAGATAQLGLATTCTFERGPGDFAAAGPEHVVELTGLTAGMRYYAKVDSPEADLVLDVIVGCDDGAVAGPGAGECLAVSDLVFTGYEIVQFDAPEDGVAYVVVDSFAEESLRDPSFVLTVDTDSCFTNEDCEEAAPFCNPGFVCEATDRCAQDSECPTSRPFCEEEVCIAFDECVGDDTAAEAASDDVAAGATPLVLTAGTATVSAHICGAPSREVDFYSLTVADGESVGVTVDWDEEGADLDVWFYTAADVDNEIAKSWYEQPEDLSVTFLPAGTYYIKVVRYMPAGTAVTPYTLTATVTSGKCTSNADCAASFEDQQIRGGCEPVSGVCGDLVTTPGAGGAVCDSDDDCTGGFCSSFPHTANADTRYICTADCTSDTECAAIAGTKCSMGLADLIGGEVCLPACTSDEQCPVNLLAVPAAGPWFHATCTDGRCIMPPTP